MLSPVEFKSIASPNISSFTIILLENSTPDNPFDCHNVFVSSDSILGSKPVNVDKAVAALASAAVADKLAVTAAPDAIAALAAAAIAAAVAAVLSPAGP